MVGDAFPESLDTHAGAQHFCELVERKGRLGARPRVLAAGCGLGHEAQYIARRLPSDVLSMNFGYAWDAALTDGSTPGLRLVEGSVLDLPFEDGSFDGIFYHHVIGRRLRRRGEPRGTRARAAP